MDSVSSGKVVENYDNKTHNDGKDDDAQMAIMLLTDKSLQKKGSVMEKEMGLVVGDISTVEVNKGCVDDPGRVVEPQCDGAVENDDQGLVTGKYKSKGVEEAIATEVNLIDEMVKHKAPEVNVEETTNDEDVQVFENAENAEKDYQGLVTGKHNTKGVEVDDTIEVNLIDVPSKHEVPEVDVEKDTRKDEDVNKFEKEKNANKDDEGLVTGKHNTKEVQVADTLEVNLIDGQSRYEVPEIDVEKDTRKYEDVNKFEKEENANKDDKGLVHGKHNKRGVEVADTPEVNLIDEPSKCEVPEVDVEKDTRKDEDVNKFEKEANKDDEGFVTGKHNTKGVLVADTPEVNLIDIIDKPSKLEVPEVDVEKDTRKAEDVNKFEKEQIANKDDEGLVTVKHNTKGVEVADRPEVNFIDEPSKHEVPEVDLEKNTRKDEDVNKFEKEENANKDDEGLVNGKHNKRGVEVADTPEVNLIDEPSKREVPEVDVEKETRKAEDVNKFEKEQIANKDDEGLVTVKHNTKGVEVADRPEVNFIDEPSKHEVPQVDLEKNTRKDEDVNKFEKEANKDDEGVLVVDTPEVNLIDKPSKLEVPEVDVEKDIRKAEDVNKFEKEQIANKDDEGLVTVKHNTKGVEVADRPEVNFIDEPSKHEVPEVDLEKNTRKDEDVNKFEKEENVNKDDEGLVTVKHITEETNEADVREVKENFSDVPNEHKVCKESAREGVLNDKHQGTYEVGTKGMRDGDAADSVDTTSVNIEDQGSVDMPPNTVETDFKNDESDLDEAEIKTVTAGDTPYTSAMKFEDLNLSAELLRGVYTEMGFQRPSKIQAITLPMILSQPYLNLVAQAHNGSGKTTCFVLGMLSRIDPKLAAPQALCVCPTRELAIQNHEVLKKMGKHIGIGSICAIPTDIGNYVAISRRAEVNEQVVIGTPGTVKKWISNKVLRTRCIEILVFDEADHMLAQDGFQDDSVRIIRDIQKNRDSCQILLFSATFNDNVKMFITRMIPVANQVFVKEEDLSLDAIKQYCVKCPNELEKIKVLKDRIFPLAEKLGQTIIFVRTRESASRLHSMLEAEGHKCTSIQGRLKAEDRDRIIGEFRSGITRILISTDVIARGFDQAQVALVVNFDLPVRVYSTDEPDYEVYLHRIGRSGRFGRKGAAFNFVVTTQDEENMMKIERHFQRHATEVRWDNEGDFESALKDAGLA